MKPKKSFVNWFKFLVPPVVIGFIFLSGMLLLFSNASPETPARLKWLRNFISLPVIEFSHFLASIVGLGLIFLAKSLLRRLDSAYVVTLILLFLGSVLSILKGFNYEEAIILGVLFVALLSCRKFFYRKGSLLMESFSPGWFAVILAIVGCFVGLGFFSYKHVEYSNELWWKFELSGNVPRFLRATVGLFICILFVLLKKLLSPGIVKFSEPDAASVDKAERILKACARSSANLVFLKDKSIFYNKKGNCFVMYRIKGHSWVVLGDPVGPLEEWGTTIREFLTQCDLYNGMAVFTEISKKQLSLYLDMGFSLLKLGEEARIHLPSFSLEAPHARNLRYVLKKTHERGFGFSIVFPPHDGALWPRLMQISDAWLKTKKTKEKQFSLGFYNEAYLSRFPLALVTLQDEIMAFANIWLGAHREEFSIDLMRYLPGEGFYGIMDLLFAELTLWGKAEGYEWFNLGMAPLSGMEDHEFSPLWHRIENLIYRYGENFYNFKGLRKYKEKFYPVWESRYLAYPAGGSLLVILGDILTITSGGLIGTKRR